MLPPMVLALAVLALPTLFSLTKDLKIDRLIGELSYPLYLVHMPLVDVMRPRLAGSSEGIVIAATSLFAAFCITFLFERHTERWRANWTRRAMVS
jgi:peptidoglycan/LPS O-acetylase OafA/YrhL